MKRAWWLGAGYAAGLGTAAWLRSKTRSAAQRYAPANLRSAVTERSQRVAGQARDTAVASAKNLGREAKRIVDDIRQAVAEGRENMHDTESELSADEPVGSGRSTGDGAADNGDADSAASSDRS